MVFSTQHTITALKTSLAFLNEFEGPPSLSWDSLQKRLHSKRFTNDQIRSILVSLEEGLNSPQKKPRIRHLHLVEKELLTIEAYGLILDSIRHHIIETYEVEHIIETLAARVPLPISLSSLEHHIALLWKSKLNLFRIH